MEYNPGRENVLVDCLSHLSQPSSDPQKLEEDKIAMVIVDLTAVTAKQLHSAYKDCPVLQQVLKHLRNGWPRAVEGLDPAMLPFYKIQTELAELD